MPNKGDVLLPMVVATVRLNINKDMAWKGSEVDKDKIDADNKRENKLIDIRVMIYKRE